MAQSFNAKHEADTLRRQIDGTLGDIAENPNQYTSYTSRLFSELESLTPQQLNQTLRAMGPVDSGFVIPLHTSLGTAKIGRDAQGQITDITFQRVNGLFRDGDLESSPDGKIDVRLARRTMYTTVDTKDSEYHNFSKE